MRNWAFRRKGGGAENSLVGLSVAATTLKTPAGDAGAAVSMAGPAAISEGRGASVTSSRLVTGFAIVQPSAQHVIDACIATILQPDLPMQHMVAAGSVVANSTSVTIVARRFIIDVAYGFTVYSSMAIIGTEAILRPCGRSRDGM